MSHPPTTLRASVSPPWGSKPDTITSLGGWGRAEEGAQDVNVASHVCTWAPSRFSCILSQGCCPLGTGSLPRANLYHYAIIHFFFYLRTTASLSNSQPCEFCFLCSSHSMALFRPSFPHGAPNRDANLEYLKAFPSSYHDCTLWLFVWGLVLLPSHSSYLQKLASLPS